MKREHVLRKLPACLLPALLVVCLSGLPPANAIILVGGNIDVHNNTGQVAHDFHVEGTIKSVTTPELEFQIGYADGTPFPNFSHSITSAGGDLWNFKADWSSQDVNPSQVGHFGLFFDVWSRNVMVNLDGWWTDQNGNRIGNWPILGFEVPTNWWDPPSQQIFRLQGDAGQDTIPVEILQLDLMSIRPPTDPTGLFNMLNVNDMDRIGNWMNIPGATGQQLIGDSFFDVFTELSVGPIGPDQLLLARVHAAWSGEPAGRWFFHLHQAHPVPEPSTWLLLGSGLAGVIVLGRKKLFRKA